MKVKIKYPYVLTKITDVEIDLPYGYEGSIEEKAELIESIAKKRGWPKPMEGLENAIEVGFAEVSIIR